MDINVIINVMLQLFIIILTGYFLFKKKIMTIEFNAKLTKVLLNVTLPAMILSSVFNQTGNFKTSEVLFVFLIAIVMYLSLPFISFILVKILKLPKADQGLYMFMNIYSNVGFMGFPVVNALYGEAGIFFAAIFNLLFNLSIFSVGIQVMNYGRNDSNKFSFKKLITPGVIASLLAIIIYFSHMTVPSFISGACSMLGNVTSPVAMLLIGANLAKMDIKSIFNDFRVYIFAICKQLILPLLLWPILKYFIKTPFTLGITLILLIMPTANNSLLFATEYGGNEELASKTVFITTLISILTIPLIIFLCIN